MVNVNCLNCSILFQKLPYEVKRTKGKNFCSLNCFNQYQRKDRKNNIKECKNCNKSFYAQLISNQRPHHSDLFQCCLEAPYEGFMLPEGNNISR